MKDNEKGFTLVEVVVSITVGMIVLGLILSILLTSFDLFGSYTSTDQRKLSADNIMDYIHSTISNTTDMRIKQIKSTDTPINGAPVTKLNEKANWHYMYVNEEGRLVVDGKVMFGGNQTEAYYGSNQSLFSLKYTVKQGTNDNFLTLNLKGTLSNDDDEGTDKYKGSYSKSDAILLSGLPSSYSSLSTSKDDGKLVVSSKEKEINRTNILYFANEKELSVQEKVEPTYTIADKLNLLSSESRNEGAFTPSKIQEYQPGEIVTYNGFTYMRTADVSVDRYSRWIHVDDIQRFNNYYIVNVKDKNGNLAISMYVPSDYIKSNSKTASKYDIKFSVSQGNTYGGIAGVVVSDESTRYLTSHPNLTARSSYFDVVYYQESSLENNNHYRGYITLAPGSCILFGGVYIYSGWERLASKSVLSVPTSTPSAAEYDPNSIYLPGDLFTYKDNLYEVIEMSTGATEVEGHQVIDANGNPQKLPGNTNNIKYGGGGSNITNLMVKKLGNYTIILDDLEKKNSGYIYSTYQYWFPKDTSMGSKNGSGFYGHSGSTYDNTDLANRANLLDWCKETSTGNTSSLTGDFAQLPTYNS